MVSLTSQIFLRCALVSSIASCSLAKTYLKLILHCHLTDKLANEQQVYSTSLLTSLVCLLTDIQTSTNSLLPAGKLFFQFLDQLFAKVILPPMCLACGLPLDVVKDI